MKKLMLALMLNVALFGASSANAGGLNQIDNQAMGCDFVDKMYIKGPEGSHIMQLSADGLIVSQVSSTKFLIMGDCEGNSSGTVLVRIGSDDTHYATLTIEEGQWKMNPEVTNIDVTNGYYYSGMEHVTGTYTYTLMFTQ